MKSSDLLIIINQQLFKIMYNYIPKDFENYDKTQKYNFSIPRRNFTTNNNLENFKVSRENYMSSLSHYGLGTKAYDKKELFMIHTFNSNFPSDFQTKKTYSWNDIYDIQLTITTFVFYYGWETYNLYIACDFYLTFIKTNKTIEIIVNEKLNLDINLFDIFHKYIIKNQNLEASDQLYGDKFKYDTSKYIWEDENKNKVQILNNVTYFTHNKKQYKLILNTKTIHIVILLIKPLINHVYHTPQYINWEEEIKPDKHNKIGGISPPDQYITRVQFIQPMVISNMKDLNNYELDYLKKRAFVWYFSYEKPTLKNITNKVEIFKNNIINIQPESIVYNNKDSELSKYFFINNDNRKLTDAFIELQKKWNIDYNETSNPFQLVRKIWRLISGVFNNKDIEKVGVFLCRKYFSFDKRSIISDKLEYLVQSGTYIKTSQVSTFKNTPFYHPLNIVIDYKDEYNKWKQQSKTELTLENEDVEIIYYFYCKLKKIELIPSIFIDSDFNIKVNDDETCLIYYNNKFQKKINPDEYNITFINEKIPYLFFKGKNNNNIYKFYEIKNGLKMYIFESIPVINDENCIYKHFQNLKGYEITIKDLFYVTKQSNEKINVYDKLKYKLKKNILWRINESSLRNNQFNESQYIEKEVNNQIIRIYLNILKYDVRSNKIITNERFNSLDIKWDHPKYGELHGTYSLYTIEPDEYIIKYVQPNIIVTSVGTTISRYHKKCFNLFTRINYLIFNIDPLKKDVKNWKLIKELYNTIFEFNSLQPWFKGKQKTDNDIKTLFGFNTI